MDRRNATVPAASGPPRGWWRGPVVALALAVAVVAMLGDAVLEHGDLARYDPAIGRWFVGERSAQLTPWAADLAVVGGPRGLPVLVVVGVVWLWVRRFRAEALFVAVTMAASTTITIVMKLAFARPRPTTDVIGAISHSFAFPSGHTLNTTVFAGLIGLLLWRSWTAAGARVAIVAGWLVVSVAMAASRVYLADHWFTDVIGGLVAGMGILAAAVLVRRTIRHLRGNPTPVGAAPERQE